MSVQVDSSVGQRKRSENRYPRIGCVCFITAGPITRLFALGPEEPGTLTQGHGAPVFPGSSRLGIEPKTPGRLVQDPTTRPIGDLIPTIGGSGAHPWRGWDP